MSEDSLGSGVEVHRTGSSVLLVSFGGIRAGTGLPGFEFRRMLSAHPCDQVFVRDLEQAWYQRGSRPEARSVPELAGWLRRFIEDGGYTRVVFVGNSMGGYAAILFGAMLDVDHALAIAPQTFVQWRRRILYRDPRWRRQVLRLHLATRSHRRYRDLVATLRHHRPQRLSVEVHYAPNDLLDRVHATYLAERWPIDLREHPNGGHQVVKHLRDTGELDAILGRVLAAAPQPARS